MDDAESESEFKFDSPEVTCGVTPALPVDDDGLDEAGALADALDDADVLFLGLDLCLAGAWPEAVAGGADVAALAGAVVMQVELGVAWADADFLATPAELGLLVVLLALGDGVGLGVGVSLGLTPGLGLTVALGEALPLGLAVAVLLELAVLPVLWLPLEDVAGSVGRSDGLLDELFLVSVTDGCVDGDGQELGVSWTTGPGTLAWELPSFTVGTGVLPWPSAVPGAAEGLLLVKA